MSRYEWEKGSVVIPSAEWPTFRRSIVEAHNDYQEQCYQAALALHERAKAKGIKGGLWVPNPGSEIRDEWRSIRRKPETWDAFYSAFKSIYRKEHGPPLKPRKKDFPMLPVTTTRKVPVGCEAHILFDFDSRTVHWHIRENNHARDHTWAHPVAKAFGQAMDRIKWTRESGGCFYGNDEYNQGAAGAMSGVNYVTRAFGPLGEKARQPVTCWM